MNAMTQTIKGAALGALSAFALSVALPSDAAADRGEDRRSDRYQNQHGNYDYDRRRDHDRSGDRRYHRRHDHDGKQGRYERGRRHQKGYGYYGGHQNHGHGYGHGYAYGHSKKCHKVVTKGYWRGHPAKIGGIQCYDRYGRGYIADSSRYLIKYLFIGYSYR